MIQISRIDHIVLRTDKLAQMLHFYVDILGCSIEREVPQAGLTQLRAGDALIDLVLIADQADQSNQDEQETTDNGLPPHNHTPRDSANMDHFCLQIEPLSEADILYYLQEQGLQPGAFERRYGAEGYGRSVYLQDPENNTVELRCQQEPSKYD